MDELVDIIADSTMRFMKETGHEAIIQGKKSNTGNSSYFHGIFEPVIHNMSHAEALTYSEHLQYFFNVGWADILGLKK
ncbi:hypothetical protein [Acetobacterium carbinolicum]|uniref:hypothetical protein n=1 Tax=Acetobacterium carbinolicum TaxID=52690 RepID=UPI0039C94F6A